MDVATSMGCSPRSSREIKTARPRGVRQAFWWMFIRSYSVSFCFYERQRRRQGSNEQPLGPSQLGHAQRHGDRSRCGALKDENDGLFTARVLFAPGHFGFAEDGASQLGIIPMLID